MLKIIRIITAVLLAIIILSPMSMASEEGMIKTVQIYLQNGEYSKAKDLLEKYIKSSPGSIDAHYLLGIAYQGMKEYDKSIETLEKVINLDNSAESAYILIASTQMEQKDDESAEKTVQRLLKVNSKSAWGNYALGVIYYNRRQLKDAINCFNRTLLIDKQFSPAYGNLAIVYYNQNQLKEARDSFQKAADYDKMNPRYLFGVGWTLRRMNEKEKSYKFFERASNLKAPTVYSAMWKLIQAYDKGNMKQSAEYLEEVFNHQPDFEKGLYFKALLLAREKKYTEAEEVLKGLLKEDPEDIDARDELKKIESLLKESEKTETVKKTGEPEKPAPATEAGKKE